MEPIRLSECRVPSRRFAALAGTTGGQHCNSVLGGPIATVTSRQPCAISSHERGPETLVPPRLGGMRPDSRLRF
jgi:hypothetical protein